MGCCLGRDRGGGDSPAPPPRNDGVLRVWEILVRWRDLIVLMLFRRYFDALRAEHSQPHWLDIEMWFWLYWIGERDGSPWFARFLPGDEV